MATERRLIDANALEQIFLDESRRLRKQIINDEVSCEETNYIRSFMPTIEWARKTVHGCPAVDAVEVVHAYWAGDEPGNWHCNHCGEYAADGGYEQTRYCPNCGAKMDGERRTE